MDMNKASSMKPRKETDLEELMTHHNLRDEQSFNELRKESRRLQYKVEESHGNHDYRHESHSGQFEGTVAEEQGRVFHMHQVAFECEQRERKQHQKEIVVEEERQRGVHNLATDNRNAATVAERDRKIVERGNQSKILGDILVADGVARQEREDMMNLIQEKELFEKRADHADSERDRLERSLDEIEKSNISQLKFKQSAARDAEIEENRFRMESEKLMAMQDELQFEKDRQKKERNHQYSLDLQAQIADNARRRQAEKESEQARAQDQFDCDQEWRSHAQDGRKLHFEDFEVPQQVSNLGSDVAKYDDNMRQSEKQQAVEDDVEDEVERKKRERNHQYSLDLQAQIADNARRRQAEKDYEQSEYERNEQWRDKATEDRKKVLEEKNMNVGWDEEPVVRKRNAPDGDLTQQH